MGVIQYPPAPPPPRHAHGGPVGAPRTTPNGSFTIHLHLDLFRIGCGHKDMVRGQVRSRVNQSSSWSSSEREARRRVWVLFRAFARHRSSAIGARRVPHGPKTSDTKRTPGKLRMWTSRARTRSCGARCGGCASMFEARASRAAGSSEMIDRGRIRDPTASDCG